MCVELQLTTCKNKDCGHFKLDHFTLNERVCLVSGCRCRRFEEDDAPAPKPKPPMFAVRIDKEGDGYVFKVEPIPHDLELLALDSAPGFTAIVEAPNPGVAVQLAWERGQRELSSLGGLPPNPT